MIHHTDWMFYGLLLMTCMLVYARVVFPRRFVQLASLKRQMILPLDPSYERSPGGALEWLLTINYGLCLSMMLFVIRQQFFGGSSKSTDVFIYLQLLLGVAIYLVFRNLIIRIAAHLFDTLKIADWWQEYLHYYRVGLGVWLPVLLFFVVFSGALSNVFIALTVLYISFFLVRMLVTASVQIRSRGGVGVMRILLYLCTLEIAPILWLLFWFFG